MKESKTWRYLKKKQNLKKKSVGNASRGDLDLEVEEPLPGNNTMFANPGVSDEIEEIENSIDNPWLVENIQVFSFLNCPECAFKAKEVGIFQDHAVRNHSQSSVLFGPNVKSEFIAVETEQNSGISIEHPIIDPLESVMNQECAITEIKTEDISPIVIDEQSLNQTETLSKNLDKKIMDISKTSCLENQIGINEQFSNDNVDIEEDIPLKRKKQKKKSMKFLPLANVPEPVKKKVVINATIPTFSVNNLSRKAQDIFKKSIGKESEKVSNNVFDPDQSPIQPNSEISSEDFKCLSSNADEITIDEQKIDPLGIISPNVGGFNKIPSNNKLGSLPYNCDICHAYGYAVNDMIIIKHRTDCEKRNVL